MIKQFFFFIAILFVFDLHSQDLSIELSIEWKHKESDVYNTLNFKNVPYLKIRYNNLSSDSIYLPKVYDNNCKLPLFSTGTLMGRHKPYKVEEIQFSYANEKSTVLIGGMPLPNNKTWVVLSDSIDCFKEEEYEIGEINQMLSDIYETVFQTNESNIVGYVQITDLKECQIFGELKGDFVFLPPRSNYIEYYNLSAFKVLGGSYSFIIAVDEINNYLFTNPSWSKENEKWEFKEVPLPEKVGDYHLYSGNFYTNKIEIEF